MVNFLLCEFHLNFQKRKKKYTGETNEEAISEVHIRDNRTQASGDGVEMGSKLLLKTC